MARFKWNEKSLRKLDLLIDKGLDPTEIKDVLGCSLSSVYRMTRTLAADGLEKTIINNGKAEKKNGEVYPSLRQLANRAAELGMSYGTYVASSKFSDDFSESIFD